MTRALWLIPTPCPSCGDHLVGVPAGLACAPCQVRHDDLDPTHGVLLAVVLSVIVALLGLGLVLAW